MDEVFLKLITDLHSNSDRQGPGSKADTLRALDVMDLPKNKKLKIADLGCGTGGQTLILAKALNAHITAVDFLADFLTDLQSKAEQEYQSANISALKASIDQLPFDKESFDVIWSEGAIYNLGFENGIKAWREYLKPGGYLAVSEITWITPSRPKEIEDFWNNAYPEIDTASNKIKQLEENGYSLAGYFYLKPSSWIDSYYQPMESRFEDFLYKNNHSEAAQAMVKENQDEMALYHKFKDYYSYGFYIARRI